MRLEGDRRRKLPNRGAVLEGLYDDLGRCRRQLDLAAENATNSLLTFPLPDLASTHLPFEELHTALMLMDCLVLLLGLEATPWAVTLRGQLQKHPAVHDQQYDLQKVYEHAPPRPPGVKHLQSFSDLAAAQGHSAVAQLASSSMESATNSLVEQISALMLTASSRDGGDMAAAAAAAAASAGLARAAAFNAEVGGMHNNSNAGAATVLDVLQPAFSPAGVMALPSAAASSAGGGQLAQVPGQPTPIDIQQYVRQRADAQLMTHLRGLNRLVTLRTDMRSQCSTLQVRLPEPHR